VEVSRLTGAEGDHALGAAAVEGHDLEGGPLLHRHLEDGAILVDGRPPFKVRQLHPAGPDVVPPDAKTGSTE
jgi:hypothetical protein